LYFKSIDKSWINQWNSIIFTNLFGYITCYIFNNQVISWNYFFRITEAIENFTIQIQVYSNLWSPLIPEDKLQMFLHFPNSWKNIYKRCVPLLRDLWKPLVTPVLYKTANPFPSKLSLRPMSRGDQIHGTYLNRYIHVWNAWKLKINYDGVRLQRQ